MSDFRISITSFFLNAITIVFLISIVYFSSDTIQWQSKKLLYSYILNTDPYADISIEDIIKTAESAYDIGQFEDGRNIYERGIALLKEQKLEDEIYKIKYSQAVTEYKIGDFPYAFNILNDLYATFKDLPPTKFRADIIINHAQTSVFLGRLAIARRQIKRAIKNCKDINDDSCLAKAYITASKLSVTSHDWNAANSYAIRAATIYEKRNDNYGTALVNNILARINIQRDDITLANEYLNQAESFFKDSDYKLSYAETLCLKADAEAYSGRIFQAKDLYKQCQETYSEISGYISAKQQINTLISLSNVLKGADKIEEALEALEDALEISQSTQSGGTTANIHLHRGAILSTRNEFDDAYDAYENAYNLYALTQDFHGEGKALLGMGEISFILADYEQARHFLSRSINTFERVNSVQEVAYLLEKIASLERVENNPKRALELLQRSEKMYNSIGMVKDAQRVREMAKLTAPKATS